MVSFYAMIVRSPLLLLVPLLIVLIFSQALAAWYYDGQNDIKLMSADACISVAAAVAEAAGGTESAH